ncbi:MAG TPA: hypothetical protein VGE27_17870 [Gemmatimonas sp.]|uniref:hypothetical protein n=1 Tax=Gemmatimonas sp. TaxID=1962908 RepID=UPI002ED8E439
MLKTILITSVALLASACLTPTEACGCSPAPPPPALFVEGEVRDAQGATVSGMIVQAVAYAGTCTAADSVTAIGGRNTVTNSAGRFQMHVDGSKAANACLRMRALRASSNMNTPATVLAQREIANVRLRGPASTAKLDSLSVALSVP